MDPKSPSKNLAFISYARKSDSQLASRLQADLERYSIPAGIVHDQEILAQRKHLRPVFRDHTDLNVRNESYRNQIENELARSRYLILICSPAAADSANINWQVEVFLRSHENDPGRIPPIIAAGSISATEGATQCLPPALQPRRAELRSRNLPLATNCTRMELMLKTASWMLKIDYVQLHARHRRRAGRRRLLVIATTAVVALITGGSVWKAYTQTRLAEKKTDIAAALDQERGRQEAAAIGNAYVGNIRLAAQSIEQGHLEAANRALDSCDPRLRGWEWGYLRGEIDQSIFRHEISKGLYPAAASPDGKHLAVLSPDRSIRITDLGSGKEIRKIDAGDREWTAIAWSSDSLRVAAASNEEDGAQIGVWNVGSGEAVFRAPCPTARQLCFGASDTRLFASTPEGAVLLFDTENGKETGKTMVLGGNPADRFVVSEDGSVLAAIDYDGRRLIFFETASGKELWRQTVEIEGGRFWDVDLSPDGSFVVVATEEAGAWLLDCSSGERITTLGSGDVEVRCVKIDDAGDWIAIRLADGTVQGFHRNAVGRSSAPALSIKPHATPVTCLAFSWRRLGASLVLVSASMEGLIHARSLIDSASSDHRGHRGPVYGIFPVSDATTPGGADFVTWGGDKTARVWSFQRARTDQGRAEAISPETIGQGNFPGICSVSPDGRYGVLRSMDLASSARLFEMSNNHSIGFLVHEKWIVCIAFDNLSLRALTGTRGGIARVWDLKEGKLLLEVDAKGGVIGSVAFSGDGMSIVAGCEDGSVQIWDSEGGKLVRRLKESAAGIGAVSFGPGASVVYSGDGKGLVTKWDATSGGKLDAFKAYDQPIAKLQVSEDGKRLLSVAEEGSAKLWNVDTGVLLGEFKPSGSLVDAVMQRTERRLMTLSDDGTLGVWDIPSATKILDVPLRARQGVSVSLIGDQSEVVVSDAAQRTFVLMGSPP